jgi:N-acetylneuraminic acid mutarotase
MATNKQGKWKRVKSKQIDFPREQNDGLATLNYSSATRTHPQEIQHSSDTEPSPRSLHASATYNSKMFIFGGYNGTSRLDDFYCFDFIQQTWTCIIGSGSGAPPSPRDRHCAVVYKDGFYVFGGFDGHARVNDLHRYDISSGQWRLILPSFTDGVPTARHSHCAVVYKDSMFVFGGYDGSYRSDLYEYNFLANRWRRIETLGRIPRARYRATCVVYGDSLILHGGHDGTRHLSDTHVLDLRSMTWSTLLSRGLVPMHRDSHIAFMYGSSMYIFGGSAGGTAMNDLHELALSEEGTGNDKTPVW